VKPSKYFRRATENMRKTTEILQISLTIPLVLDDFLVNFGLYSTVINNTSNRTKSENIIIE